jgi:hypothetical protein
MGENRNAYRLLVGKPEGKRPLGRPRRSWMNTVKMDLREIGWDGMNWIDLAQVRDQWRAQYTRHFVIWIHKSYYSIFHEFIYCIA